MVETGKIPLCDNFFRKCEECDEDLIVEKGYVVCPQCGAIDKKKHPLDVQEYVPARREQTATHSESGDNFESNYFSYSDKFDRLALRQKYKKNPNEYSILSRSYYILKTFLSNSQTPMNPSLNETILALFKQIREKKKGAHFTNPHYLIPTLAYFYYKSHNIDISLKSLYEYSHLSEDKYIKTVKALSEGNWLKEVKLYDIRVETLIYLSRFKEEFSLDKTFLEMALDVVRYHWDLFTLPVLNGTAKHIAATIVYAISLEQFLGFDLQEFYLFFKITKNTIKRKYDYLVSLFGLPHIKRFPIKTLKRPHNKSLKVLRKEVVSKRKDHKKRKNFLKELFNRRKLREKLIEVPHLKGNDRNQNYSGRRALLNGSLFALTPTFFKIKELLFQVRLHLIYSALITILHNPNKQLEFTGKDPPFCDHP